MKAVAIVQARWGSTRLPGKVLKKLGQKTVLEHIVNRLRRVEGLDDVVIATSTAEKDTRVAKEAERLRARTVRGSEHDVLGRYAQAARETSAECIVRVTADCPLIDPVVVQSMLAIFRESRRGGHLVDYMSNTHPRRFPRGLDTEIFTREALERAAAEAKDFFEREHVTPYFYFHPEKFVIQNHLAPDDQSRHRWTLDTKEDLLFLRKIYTALECKGNIISTVEVLHFLAEHPEIVAINSKVVQKSIQLKGTSDANV